jgi:ComEC/Rec2-related protein
MVSSLVGILIGSNISDKVLKVPNKIIPEIPAIFEGKVIKIFKTSSNYTRCLCDGWLDAKQMKKLSDTRLIITIFNKEKTIQIKSGDILFSNVYIRPPQKKILKTDFPEWQFCASYNAQWLGRSNSNNTAILAHSSNLKNRVENVSVEIGKKIELLFSHNTSPIVKAILLGDKSEISPETRRVFALSGTAHIIAVSGLHIGIIAGVIYLILGFIGNRFIKFIIFSIAIIFFVILTGTQPSALRAGVMAIAIMLVKISERRIELLNILGVIFIFVLLFSPELIYSVGFQLSAGAIFGIAVLIKPITDFFKRMFKPKSKILDYIINSLSITFAASLIVSPLVALYFGTYSIISPLANLMVIPLMSLALIFSLIAVILSYIIFPLSLLYAGAVDLLIHTSYLINDWIIQLPIAYLEGDSSLIVSVIITILFIYIIFSKSLMTAGFRLVASSLAFICILIIIHSGMKGNSIELFPRGQLVALKIPIKDSSTFFILADRKPNQYPVSDLGLENYILQSEGDLILGITGSVSLDLYNRIKDVLNVKYIELDYPQQERIRNLLGISERLSQINDLDYEY